LAYCDYEITKAAIIILFIYAQLVFDLRL